VLRRPEDTPKYSPFQSQNAGSSRYLILRAIVRVAEAAPEVARRLE